MTDLFKLILDFLASLFKLRARLEAQTLRQQINVFHRRAPKPPHLNDTDHFLFVAPIATFRASWTRVRLLDSWTLTPQGDHLMSQSDQLKRQRGATRFVPSVIQYGNIAAKPALSEMNHRYARI
jgi:hypothetical protein